MSRLTETQRAYDSLTQLLDQEIRKRSGAAKDLEGFRETLDVAFYLLGWAQFEYLVRQAAEGLVEEKIKSRTVERHAWQYVRDNIKQITVRRRLDMIFHSNPGTRAGLAKDYEIRNESAHNYKLLPKEARNLSMWLQGLEDLVAKF